MEVEHVPEKSEKQKKEKDQKKKKKHKKKKDKKQKNKDKKKKKKKKHKKARKDKKAKDRESESDDGDEVADRIIRSPMPEADRKLTGFIDLFEAAIAKYPEKGIFIDFYGGVGKAAARAESKYGLIGVNIDWQKDHAWDLHTQGVLPYISKKVLSGRVKGGHIATDCTSFSSARHGKQVTTVPAPCGTTMRTHGAFQACVGRTWQHLRRATRMHT
jgi:hypothetical protein